MIPLFTRIWQRPFAWKIWTCLFVATAVLRILLSFDQKLGVIDAGFDDALFLSQSRAIVSGVWLGDYSETTLAKGPFFAVYLALTHVLFVPLVFSYHFSYILACGLFICAVAPLVRHPALRLSLFSFLIFNPASFEAQNHTRILRDGIYAALTMLVLTGVVGYFLRSRKLEKSTGSYGMLLGCSFPMFWLTREEGIWLVPSILLLLSLADIRILRMAAPALRTRLPVLVKPVVVAGLILSLFGVLNMLRFGAFVLVETQSAAFQNAYGALMRVAVLPPRAFVPVRKDNRLAAYRVSPAFNQLRVFLEKEVGQTYIEVSCEESKVCDDIAGGWFIWALRSAVQSAGYYDEGSARKVLQFYQSIGQEVNAACDDGRLNCLPRRSGINPPWLEEYSDSIIPSFKTFVSKVFRFTELSFVGVPSAGSEEFVRAAGQFTRSDVADIDEPHHQSPVREAAMLWFAGLYERITAPLSLISFFGIIALVAIRPRHPAVRDLSWILMSLAGAFLARSVIFSYLNVSSYYGMHFRYLSPLQMISLTFSGFFCASLVQLVVGWNIRKDRSTVSSRPR